MKKTYNWLNWMKAIGMFTIVWGHSFPPYIAEFLYSFNVGAFFIISGFLSKCKPDITPVGGGKKIISTLVVPYICLCSINLFFYSLSLIKNGGLSVDMVINSIIANLLGFQGLKIDGCGCGPLWFVYTLIIIKTMCIFLRRRVFLLLSILCFLACIYLNLIGYDNDWSVTNVLIASPCFSIGLFLASYKEKVDVLTNAVLGLNKFTRFSLIVTLILITLVISNYNGQVRMFTCSYGINPILFLLGTITGSTLLMLLSMSLDKVRLKLITIISNGNILILSFHLIFLNRILVVLNGINCSPIELTFATFVISIFIIILFYPIILLTNKFMPILTGNR